MASVATRPNNMIPTRLPGMFVVPEDTPPPPPAVAEFMSAMAPPPDDLLPMEAPAQAPEPAPYQTPPNLPFTAAEETTIVALCNEFKTNSQEFHRGKKETMRKCYAAFLSQLEPDDLLPIPSAEGSENDVQSTRPQVFVPTIRQQIKTLYAQAKLIFFPNDEDYFRVRAKTSEDAAQEDDMTEALKYLFRASLISEKLGGSLLNALWSGIAAVFPVMEQHVVAEWKYDPTKPDQYGLTESMTDPMCDVENLNPLYFYIDPVAKNAEQARWLYAYHKSVQDIEDSPLYTNKVGLESLGKNTPTETLTDTHTNLIDALNGHDNRFKDITKHVSYDLYYFPSLKVNERVYRNIVVGIAAGVRLVRFQPNLYPKGLNPVVHFNWMPNSETLDGTGPVEDMLPIQKTLNMMVNYLLESLSRNGNRWGVDARVDMSNLSSVTGGIMVNRSGLPIDQAIKNFSGDFRESDALLTMMGVLKQEMQSISAAQGPIQGAMEQDFKKTATEATFLNETSISVLREVVEHISVTGMQRILERLMLLVGQYYQQPLSFRLDQEGASTQFKKVDLRPLAEGRFTIELTNVNPSQSKQAQINSLMQLLTTMLQDERLGMMARDNFYPFIRMLFQLSGNKRIDEVIYNPEEMAELLSGQPTQASEPGQPGLPMAQGVPPTGEQPPVDPLLEALLRGAQGDTG